MKEMMNSMEAKMNLLKKERDSMEASMDSLKAEQEELKEETAHLKHKLRVVTEEKEHLFSFSTDVERRYDVLQETNSSLLASNTKIQKDYERVQEALSYSEEQYSRLEQYHISSQRTNEKECSNVTLKLSDAERDKENLQAENDRLERELAHNRQILEEERQNMKVRLDSTVQQLAEVQGCMEQVNQKLQESMNLHELESGNLPENVAPVHVEKDDLANLKEGVIECRHVQEKEALQAVEYDLKGKINCIQEATANLNCRVCIMTEKMVRLSGWIIDLRKVNHDLINAKSSLSARYSEMQEKCEKLQEAHSHLIRQNEEECTTMRMKLEDAQEHIGSLRKEMDFLAEQRQKIKVQLEETLKQLDVANCCVKKVNMELQESKDKHHLLSREIDDKNSRIEHLQGERVHLKEEINAHEKKYLESSAAIDEVNARLHSNENDTKVLKGQRDELKNVLQSELKKHHKDLQHHKEVINVMESSLVKQWTKSLLDHVLEDALEVHVHKVEAQLENIKLVSKEKDRELSQLLALNESNEYHLAEQQLECKQLLEMLKEEQEKSTRLRNENSDLESAQFELQISKKQLEQDFESSQAEVNKLQVEVKKLTVKCTEVERKLQISGAQVKELQVVLDQWQEKFTRTQRSLLEECDGLKVQNKVLKEDNAVCHKALESKMVHVVEMEEENKKLKKATKEDRRIKIEKQMLKEGRKVLEQNMMDYEKRKATLQSKEELIREEQQLFTRRYFEDDQKFLKAQFMEFKEEQLQAFDKWCSEVDDSFREQCLIQMQRLEDIVQGMEEQYTKSSKEQDLLLRDLKKSGGDVVNELHSYLYSGKETVRTIEKELQKVPQCPAETICVDTKPFVLLPKLEIITILLNSFDGRCTEMTNAGLCQPVTDLTSQCDLNSLEVFDACDLPDLSHQLKCRLPLAVDNFIQSVQRHASEPNNFCCLPFLTFTEVVILTRLIVVSTPFQIVVGDNSMPTMKSTFACILARVTLSSKVEEDLILCQKSWKNVAKGVLFQPEWLVPKKLEDFKYSFEELPSQLEPVLEQLAVRTAINLSDKKLETCRELLSSVSRTSGAQNQKTS
jgi:hypothetical protein